MYVHVLKELTTQESRNYKKHNKAKLLEENIRTAITWK